MGRTMMQRSWLKTSCGFDIHTTTPQPNSKFMKKNKSKQIKLTSKTK